MTPARRQHQLLKETHLWLLRPEQAETFVEPQAAAHPPLPSDEVHYQRIIQPARREEHRIAFVFRRWVLAHYLGDEAYALVFQQERLGRPVLDQPSDLDFNVTHSDGWVSVALSRQGRVGVDIECGAHVSAETIDRLLPQLAEDERKTVLQSRDRVCATLRIWVLKEACSKALGLGLAQPLDELKIVTTCERPMAVPARPETKSSGYWTLHYKTLGQNAALGVALRSERLLDQPALKTFFFSSAQPQPLAL